MKEKLLLLLKACVCSIVLFICWQHISKIYGYLLNFLFSIFYPERALAYSDIPQQFPYLKSLMLVPFISLVAVTPRIKILKKVLAVVSMIFAFLLLDFFAVMFRIDTISNNPSAYLAYRSIKLLTPLLIWISVGYPAVFKTQTE